MVQLSAQRHVPYRCNHHSISQAACKVNRGRVLPSAHSSSPALSRTSGYLPRHSSGQGSALRKIRRLLSQEPTNLSQVQKVLTSLIKSSTSWEQLYEHLAEHRQHLNHIHYTAAFTHLTTLPARSPHPKPSSSATPHSTHPKPPFRRNSPSGAGSATPEQHDHSSDKERPAEAASSADSSKQSESACDASNGSYQAAGAASGEVPPSSRSELAHYLSSCIVAQLQGMDARGLANVLWAHASLHVTPVDIEALLEACLDRIQDFTPQQLCNLMWAAASLQLPCSSDWMEAVLCAARSILFDCSLHGLAQLCWALASMEVQPDADWLDDLCQACAARLEQNDTSDCTSQTVSMTFWSLAKLSHHPGSHVLELYLDHQDAVGWESCSSQSLSNTAWALASLGHTPSSSAARSFLAATQQLLHKTAQAGTRQHTAQADHEVQFLSNLGWAVASMKLQPSRAWLDAYATACHAYLPHFTGPAYSNLAWALARLRYTPSADWMCDYLLHSKKNLDAFAPEALALTSWSLAKFYTMSRLEAPYVPLATQPSSLDTQSVPGPSFPVTSTPHDTKSVPGPSVPVTRTPHDTVLPSVPSDETLSCPSTSSREADTKLPRPTASVPSSKSSDMDRSPLTRTWQQELTSIFDELAMPSRTKQIVADVPSVPNVEGKEAAEVERDTQHGHLSVFTGTHQGRSQTFIVPHAASSDQSTYPTSTSHAIPPTSSQHADSHPEPSLPQTSYPSSYNAGVKRPSPHKRRGYISPRQNSAHETLPLPGTPTTGVIRPFSPVLHTQPAPVTSFTTSLHQPHTAPASGASIQALPGFHTTQPKPATTIMTDLHEPHLPSSSAAASSLPYTPRPSSDSRRPGHHISHVSAAEDISKEEEISGLHSEGTHVQDGSALPSGSAPWHAAGHAALHDSSAGISSAFIQNGVDEELGPIFTELTQSSRVSPSSSFPGVGDGNVYQETAAIVGDVLGRDVVGMPDSKHSSHQHGDRHCSPDKTSTRHSTENNGTYSTPGSNGRHRHTSTSQAHGLNETVRQGQSQWLDPTIMPCGTDLGAGGTSVAMTLSESLHEQIDLRQVFQQYPSHRSHNTSNGPASSGTDRSVVSTGHVRSASPTNRGLSNGTVVLNDGNGYVRTPSPTRSGLSNGTAILNDSNGHVRSPSSTDNQSSCTTSSSDCADSNFPAASNQITTWVDKQCSSSPVAGTGLVMAGGAIHTCVAFAFSVESITDHEDPCVACIADDSTGSTVTNEMDAVGGAGGQSIRDDAAYRSQRWVVSTSRNGTGTRPSMRSRMSTGDRLPCTDISNGTSRSSRPSQHISTGDRLPCTDVFDGASTSTSVSGSVSTGGTLPSTDISNGLHTSPSINGSVSTAGRLPCTDVSNGPCPSPSSTRAGRLSATSISNGRAPSPAASFSVSSDEVGSLTAACIRNGESSSSASVNDACSSFGLESTEWKNTSNTSSSVDSTSAEPAGMRRHAPCTSTDTAFNTSHNKDHSGSCTNTDTASDTSHGRHQLDSCASTNTAADAVHQRRQSDRFASTDTAFNALHERCHSHRGASSSDDGKSGWLAMLPDWLQAALEAFSQHWDRVPPHSLSMMLWAAAKVKYRPDERWLEEFMRVSEPLLGSFNSQDLSNTVWALSHLNVRLEDTWLDSFQSASVQLASSMSPQDACVVLWSCATLKLELPHSWLRAYLMSTVPLLNRFKPGDYAQCLWSLASLQHVPPSPWLSKLLDESSVQLSLFGPQDLSITLWALAKVLHGRPLPREWVHTFLTASTRHLSTSSCQSLVNTGWAVAALRPSCDPAIANPWLCVWLQRIHDRAWELTPPATCAVMWTLYRLQCTPPQGWMEHLMEQVHPKLCQFNPNQLAMLIWGIHNSGHFPPRPWLLTFMATAQQLLPDFPSKPASVIATALAQMDMELNEVWLSHFLMAASEDGRAHLVPVAHQPLWSTV